jgi:hypothetical protein
MEDFAFIQDMIAQLKNAEQLKGTVVVNSQQIVGDVSERGEPSLAARLSRDEHGAMVRHYLEAAKRGETVPEDAAKTEEMNNAVAEKYVDELLNKFFGDK